MHTIKAEIKALAVELRSIKYSIKDHQRNGRWESLWSQQSTCRKKAWRCRHLLIAYGLMRGLTYEQIERPRQGNEPDMQAVEEIRHAPVAA